MKLSEMIAFIGDENIRVQNLLESCNRIEWSRKKNCCTIGLETREIDHSDILNGTFKRTALVIWFDLELYRSRLKYASDNPGAFDSEKTHPLREWVPSGEEPQRAGVHATIGCPMWSVPGWLGGPCTDYTLYQQRLYAFHGNGRWSRPKDRSTSISISEET